MKSIKRVVLAALLGVSGCSFLAAQPDASRFFSLATVTPIHQGEAAPEAIAYGLGPVSFPAYLDRNELAVRISPTELSYSATDRWAEPLAINATRVLLQNLTYELQTEHVSTYPWEGQMIDYQVRVDVFRFEADRNGSAALAARWQIIDGRSRKRLATRTSTFTHPAENSDGAAVSAALSASLADLSTEIAAALRVLPAAPHH